VSAVLLQDPPTVEALMPATDSATPRLLAGTPLAAGAEQFDEHRERLGRRPRGGEWMFDVLERSGLRGRGGAWFSTSRKWRGAARAAAGQGAVVVVNASEGEPLSAKDKTLVEHRPHLVLDGALLAAETVGAGEVVIYLSRPSRAATRALHQALRARRRAGLRDVPVHLMHTAHRYVAGESSAVVRRANGGPAKPGFAPPHPLESGIGGRPTLVQNAETIAHAALIARYGDSWFRERGTDEAPGTALVTLCGNVRYPGVYEIDLGATLEAVLAGAGGTLTPPAGILVGGYFGSWLPADSLAGIRLTPGAVTCGCGVIGVLGADACGLSEAASISAYLARESAGQCGPCVHGLRAIAETMTRLAASDADQGDLVRLQRWTGMVAGRGACHHPDGAINNAVSALDAFPHDLLRHVTGQPCAGRHRPSLPPPPKQPWRASWR
jgi:NADH:ubiquinone oxidoreductase subunit F (NADH-binding)